MPWLSKHTAPVNAPIRIRPGKRNSLRQALQLQQRVFEEGMKPGIKPTELAHLARAWECLEDRKRILRGRPLPGSFKPVKLPAKPYCEAATFAEPTEPNEE